METLSKTYKRYVRLQNHSFDETPWFQMKTISITHEERLTEELFSRDVVDRIKTGYEFLLPYYDYFLTLPSDPEPETLK